MEDYLDIPNFIDEVMNFFIEAYNKNFDNLVSKAILDKGFNIPTSTKNKFKTIKLNGVNYLYHKDTFICWWSDDPSFVFEDNKVTARLCFGTDEPTCSNDIIKGFK